MDERPLANPSFTRHNQHMNLPALQHQALELFHPAVSTWFRRHFATVTDAQARAWPLIHAGQSMLLAAPTGSGKTLSAFLAVLDELFREGLEHGGELPAQTQVVYVSPLKALSNDIRLNLQAPLEGISQALEDLGLKAPRIATAVRTGDTPQKERAAMRKQAPHILVTTPESLYVLMGSASGREGLASVHTVIVDEIHALAGNKRGAHLALTLERLQALCGRPLRRIGLSATQRPVERVAQFLVGQGRPCATIDVGHARQRDLAIEVPPVPLGAVMATDVWAWCTTAWPTWRERIAPHWCSSTPVAWPNASPVISASASARRQWPRTTAACPRSCAWTPNSA